MTNVNVVYTLILAGLVIMQIYVPVVLPVDQIERKLMGYFLLR